MFYHFNPGDTPGSHTEVLGPVTDLNKSAVNVEFIDRASLKRTFISNVLYGHYFKANRKDRLPFKTEDEIEILVNPKDFNQAEIGTSMYLWIGLTLLQATLLNAYNLYRIKI
jgi:hypothetical protein